MYFHPWHSISPGDDAPEVVRSIIEIPRGCKAKYEIDKESGLLRLDRALFSAVHYPANYGFIPRTYADDADPLDILVLSQIDVFPRTILEARPLGGVEMTDAGEEDHKIIAVAVQDVSVNQYEQIEDLPGYILDEIINFFRDYKKLEGKSGPEAVKVENFYDKTAAESIISAAIDSYAEKFGPLGGNRGNEDA